MDVYCSNPTWKILYEIEIELEKMLKNLERLRLENAFMASSQHPSLTERNGTEQK
jgi:hypothetical protein